MALQSRTAGTKPRRRIDSSHYLYIAVIVAVLAGITVGLAAPEFAVGLKPIGDAFVMLIKMMIAPIIFCTIVLGVGSIAKAATVGKVGGLALLYFMVMSTFALGIGLVVGNLIHPGEGLNIANATYDAGTTESKTTSEFILGIIPTSLLSSLVDGNILQVLFVALLVGFALQKMGSKGTPILGAIRQIQALVFRILAMIMWVAPIGAFGAIAAVVGNTGIGAIFALGTLMVAFYITCALFVVVVLGSLLWAVTRVNIFRMMKYLGREYLLIVSTSSSEVVLPRLIAKMEHAGVSKPVAGITIPTGYSFNLDGTAIYLTMASLFIASAMGTPLSLGEQIGAAAVHDGRVEGRRGRHRRRPRDPRGRPAGAPARPRRRRRRDRRHRPVHVRGARAHELHRQRRGDAARGHLDEAARPRAAARRARRRPAVRRDHHERRRPPLARRAGRGRPRGASVDRHDRRDRGRARRREGGSGRGR